MSLFSEPLKYVAVQCVSPHSAKISSSPFAVQCVSPYSACRHTVEVTHSLATCDSFFTLYLFMHSKSAT